MSLKNLSRRLFLTTPVGVAGAVSACGDDSDTEPEPEPEPIFQHGVASGDPLGDAVILWTRVTADEDEVEVSWEIATDPELSSVVASGTVTASADTDFTVKVDATGLSPATTYFYRFSALEESSPIGRTRTVDSGSPTRLRFGLVSCSSYAHGYFHVYRRLAERTDLDAIIHLGDYIYEYADGEYGSIRTYDPPHEIVSLEDYRRRYAHYRKDPDLAELHRQHPVIAIWDDHELANNSHATGAENHDPETEGSFAERKAAAAQVYSEWMPIRLSDPGKIWRSIRFGDLCELFLCDTRLWGRDAQALDQDDPDLVNPDRTLLGLDQEQWLAEGLAASTSTFKLVGQQVMMAPLPLENLKNTDQWDGYPAARERFYALLTAGQIDNVMVLTGDIHTSWAADLIPEGVTYDPATGAGAVAGELVVPAVSSPGLPDLFVDFAAQVKADNPYLKLVDLTLRGYVILDLDADRAQGAYFHVDTVEDPEGAQESFSGAVSLLAGANHLVDGGNAAPDGDPRPPAP